MNNLENVLNGETVVTETVVLAPISNVAATFGFLDAVIASERVKGGMLHKATSDRAKGQTAYAKAKLNVYAHIMLGIAAMKDAFREEEMSKGAVTYLVDGGITPATAKRYVMLSAIAVLGGAKNGVEAIAGLATAETLPAVEKILAEAKITNEAGLIKKCSTAKDKVNPVDVILEKVMKLTDEDRSLFLERCGKAIQKHMDDTKAEREEAEANAIAEKAKAEWLAAKKAKAEQAEADKVEAEQVEAEKTKAKKAA